MNRIAVRISIGLLSAALLLPLGVGSAAAATSVTWTRASSGPWLIWDADAFAPTTGRLVVFGGTNLYTGVKRETYLFDPIGTSWTVLPVLRSDPSARVEARMVWDPDLGRIVLFGGRDARGVSLQDTWAFDPVARKWTALIANCRKITCPPARWGQGMVWSSTLHRVLMFGGVATLGAPFNDLWAFDGRTWTRIVTSTQPAARYLMGMAEDPTSGQVLLYGGVRNTPFSDTWTFNPSTKAWARVPTANLPDQRAEVGMAWLPSIGRVVISSGADATGCQGRTNSVWAFDPLLRDWVRLTVTGALPTPRTASYLITDPLHGSAILHGPPDATVSSDVSDYTWILR